MALEQNKVTAVQRRQIGVQQHKDDLAAIKTKLDAFKSRGRRAQRHRHLEGDPDDHVVGPDQDRRLAARRRRHRRSLDPGPQARLLGPARLHVRAERDRRLADAALRHRPGSTPRRQQQGHDRDRRQRDRRRRGHGDQRQRGLARLRRRDQGERRRRARRPLRPQDRRELELHGRHLRDGRRLLADRGARLRARRRRRPQRLLHARRRGARRASPSPTSSRTRSRACG